MEQDEYDYVSYGTPLPDLEEESVLRKKAAKELEVRDEKGRQRFHGAFTGGFSAGYFNTVGTKEGWAPTTFVSSRNKTAERFQQNPEDFMDEEDLGEFGISTRRIQTTSKFADSSDLKNKRKYAEVDSIIPGEAPLKDLVKPVRESIGIEILKKLGWKLGQGIGPRVKKDASTKVYGCSPFPDSSRMEEDDLIAHSYTFSPKDIEAEVYAPKDDVFGLGYTGLSKQSILGSQIDTSKPTFTKSWLKKDKKKLTISGQAFGVGAFEDDDEDIYSKDDMSQYDFSDLGANTAGQRSSKTECQQPGTSVAVLEGFCLATEPPPIKKYFPPPNLPPNFKPVRSSIPKVPVSTGPQFKSRHAMSSEDRSVLLGEKKFQSFQISSDKKDIEKKTESSDKLKITVTPTKHTFRPFPNDQLKQERYEEYLKLKETQEVEKLVQPSSMTEWEKQQEIEEFSRAAILFKPLSAALSSKFESKSHLSVEHEVMEAIAKAKKETENVKTSIDKRKLVGLSKRITLEWHPASLLCKRFNVPNPYPNSSEVSGSQKSKSLFDHISFDTNESLPNASTFVPSETKTSNPPDAEPYTSVERASNVNELLTNVVLGNKNKSSQESPIETKKPPIDFFKDIFENSSSDEESPQTEPSTQSTNSVPKTVTSTETVIDSKPSPYSEDLKDPVSLKETKRVGFGVFANLDLDALNKKTSTVKASDDSGCMIIDEEVSENTNKKKDASRLPELFNDPLKQKTSIDKTTDNTNFESANKPTSSESSKNDVEVLTSSKTSISTSLPSHDLYGPDLPPNYSVSTDSNATKSMQKKHSKHKMKHKHKHHKHKSKKKKKKESSHKSSDESSFASDEDIPPTVILEKLKKLQKVLKSNH